MRHRKKAIKLDRNAPARKALLRDLATSLVLHGRIRTTAAKGKAVRPKVERLVTIAKRGTVASRRLAARTLRTEAAVQHLFTHVAPRCKERAGGYTRMLKVGPRQGDGAQMVLIEFVDHGSSK